MRILGVDPGTETTGYGLIDADPSGTRLRLITYGEIAGPARRRPLPLRLATVFRGLTELIRAVMMAEVDDGLRGHVADPNRGGHIGRAIGRVVSELTHDSVER